MPEIITIVGGGLAGLTLGIGLRQRGVPVTVWEAGIYPRHRVCGEVISGGGQRSLARLELLSRLQRAETCPAQSVAFFARKTRVPARALPEAALCVSRYILDDWLAHGILPGLVIICFAWIMDEGRKIQEEQELTV